MLKNKIIYWSTTGVISLMMLFAAYKYLTDPKMAENFARLGFPKYFMIELALAKITGVLVLLIPQLPVRIKEWAYAGFGIVYISAFIAHFNNEDTIKMIITPVVALLILLASNIYLHKLQKV